MVAKSEKQSEEPIRKTTKFTDITNVSLPKTPKSSVFGVHNWPVSVFNKMFLTSLRQSRSLMPFHEERSSVFIFDEKRKNSYEFAYESGVYINKVTIRGEKYFVLPESYKYLRGKEIIETLESIRSSLAKSDNIIIDFYINTSDVARPTAQNVMPDGEKPTLEPKENIQDGFTSAAEAKAFGEMFQRARKDEGKSQRATARESGIDPKNLRQIEHGITDPSLKTMCKIADSIGFKIELTLIPKGKE
ncbi:MAG: helix-turn-helix domain-containing protein [Alphaproteobacteria bacterium]